jgi:hypothetical protein
MSEPVGQQYAVERLARILENAAVANAIPRPKSRLPHGVAAASLSIGLTPFPCQFTLCERAEQHWVVKCVAPVLEPVRRSRKRLRVNAMPLPPASKDFVPPIQESALPYD